VFGAGRVVVSAALVAAGVIALPASGSPTSTSVCRPSAAPKDAPTNGESEPPPAPRYFAHDFPTITDSQWKIPIGGIGGLHRHAPLHHTPVIFVHGNQADAQNWLSPMLQFQRLAHYSMQEMYALSYNGLGNVYAGAPIDEPTTPDDDYFQQNPTMFANGGHGAANEDNIPDVCRFILAVQAYTGSRQVDIVTHSLGDTIVRKLLVDYPWLRKDVVAAVSIAGANHGTSVCRGLESSFYGCNEIAPGSPWLAALNKHGESPGPTHWMSVYNGSAGDPFFDPPYDENSPHLAGALNKTYPGAYHNNSRVDTAAVDDYLAFLLQHGQAGIGADRPDAALAKSLAATHPDGRTGTLCGIPKLTGC